MAEGKNKIVYIPDFSSPADNKVEALKRAFPQAAIYREAVSVYPHSAADDLCKLVDRLSLSGQVTVVGLGVGAFWAHWVADRYGCPAVLLNPNYRPDLTLGRYSTGTTYSEGRKFTEEDVEAYSEYRGKFDNSSPMIVLVEEGSKVLSPYKAAWKYKNRADVRIVPGGDHTFKSLDVLIDTLGEVTGLTPKVEAEKETVDADMS